MLTDVTTVVGHTRAIAVQEMGSPTILNPAIDSIMTIHPWMRVLSYKSSLNNLMITYDMVIQLAVQVTSLYMIYSSQ